MGKIKNEQIPLGFTMVSFDIKSLFTSVPLTEAMDIISDRVYNRKEISTVLTKNEMENIVSGDLTSDALIAYNSPLP